MRSKLIARRFHDFLPKYGALFFLLGFAALQFVLILRHKSPYLSDSYFYKHIYYQIKGISFDEAYAKITSQINVQNSDEITRNIFTKKEAYQKSYSFFTKRPLYPLTAVIIGTFVKSEYLVFLIPVFLSYMASLILTFNILIKGLNYFFAIFTLALFIAFYPFLDWSTYFLTDTIGLFFWLLQLIFIYKFVYEGKHKFLVFFTASLTISLLNREQSILMVPLFVLLYLLLVVFKFKSGLRQRCLKLLNITLLIAILYVLISKALKLPTILDTIVYTQNSYGLYNIQSTSTQTLFYLARSVFFTHVAFLGDLTRHHWWFTFFVLGLVGIFKTLGEPKKSFIDLLILASGIAAYFSIFVYPVLSYRFFFPTVIMILYFASKFIFKFFHERGLVVFNVS